MRAVHERQAPRVHTHVQGLTLIWKVEVQRISGKLLSSALGHKSAPLCVLLVCSWQPLLCVDMSAYYSHMTRLDIDFELRE